MAPASNLRAAEAMVVVLVTLLPGCVLLPPPPDYHALEAIENEAPLLGAWLGSWPSDENRVIEEFEEEIEIRLDLVDVYLDWYTPFANVSHTIEHIAIRGSVPILTWEAHGFTTVDILEGDATTTLRDGRAMNLDAYLAEFAKGVCDVAQDTRMPVFVRALHEMNGDWFSWGSSWEAPNGDRPNTDANYRAAWIKIWQRFHDECSDDVKFVWAVNHFSVGEGATFAGTYPGDAYVDYVGIDGYNWGSRAPWGWQSFETIFQEAYCAVTATSGKPLLLNEIASTESGGSKAAWIRDLYYQFERYDQIRGFVWFNSDKFEIQTHGNMDWAVDSSPASLAAFSEVARGFADENTSGNSTIGANDGRGDPC